MAGPRRGLRNRGNLHGADAVLRLSGTWNTTIVAVGDCNAAEGRGAVPEGILLSAWLSCEQVKRPKENPRFSKVDSLLRPFHWRKNDCVCETATD